MNPTKQTFQRLSLTLCVLMTTLFLGSARLADATPIIFGASHSGPDGDSQFHSVDATTGLATAIGTGIGFERVGGMDFHPDSGLLYATGERLGGSDTPVLITIDTTTGVGTEVAVLNGGLDHSFGDAYADISFRSDGILYTYLEPSDGVGTIDIGTGALTELGFSSTPSCCGNGLAFSSGDTLYHSNDVQLNTLDQVSGAHTFVAGHTFDITDDPRINGMDFDATTGVLWGFLNDGSGGSGANYLATVDIGTGAVSTIGVTASGMDALAIQTIPEPSTYALLAAGLLGWSTLRRRQRK